MRFSLNSDFALGAMQRCWLIGTVSTFLVPRLVNGRSSLYACRHRGPTMKGFACWLHVRLWVFLTNQLWRLMRNVVVFFRITVAERRAFTPWLIFTSALVGSLVEYFHVFKGAIALAVLGIWRSLPEVVHAFVADVGFFCLRTLSI